MPAPLWHGTFYLKLIHLWGNSSSANHSSILRNLFGSNLWWLHTKQRSKNAPTHHSVVFGGSHCVCRLFRDHYHSSLFKVFPGVSLESLSRTCLNHLHREIFTQEVTTETRAALQLRIIHWHSVLREVISLMLNFHVVGVDQGCTTKPES